MPPSMRYQPESSSDIEVSDYPPKSAIRSEHEAIRSRPDVHHAKRRRVEVASAGKHTKIASEGRLTQGSKTIIPVTKSIVIRDEPSEEDSESVHSYYKTGRDLGQVDRSKRTQTHTPETSECESSSRASHDRIESQKKVPNVYSIIPSPLRIPRSQYAGYCPPLDTYAEKKVVREFLAKVEVQQELEENEDQGEEFIEFELTDFVAYLPESVHHAYEFRGLQDLATRAAHSCFLFDGILSTGQGSNQVKRYVEAVPFQICSLGNYGIEHEQVGGHVWIQSDFNSGSDIYYRLKAPAPEYLRFHEGFQWLADFAKHFVDYCHASLDKKKDVSVHDFREDFSRWLLATHPGSSAVGKWHKKYTSHGFHRAVTANIDFLFKESIGVDEDLRNLSIWNELLHLDHIQPQELRESQTIVTPYVYDCFKDLIFGQKLKKVTPTATALEQCAQHGIELDLRTNTDSNLTKADDLSEYMEPRAEVRENSDLDATALRRAKIEHIKVGDVLSIAKDVGSSVWKDEVSRFREVDSYWYVYVQQIHISKKGERSFTAIWLYKPCDTSCAKMKYPYANELFFSNHCTCSEGDIEEDRVVDVIKVKWHGHPLRSGNDSFVRQTYEDCARFRTFRESDRQCEHFKESLKVRRYAIGQTVLAPYPRQKDPNILEPCEVVEYRDEGNRSFVILRRLRKRSQLQPGCRPNELLYTDRAFRLNAKKVTRTCLVRFYTQAEVSTNITLPAPYGRNGTGNAFFITTRLIEKDGEEPRFVPIYDNMPRFLIEGFDPQEVFPSPKLRGLDLYCGGGNFGRGLEEAGAVEHAYAVDIAKNQIHTYYANLKHPKSTNLFYGSVDDMLYKALQGNLEDCVLIPLPGGIDFICAGSPCQGFTILNLLRQNDKGLKNQSLVASVASYVDFYRPKYGLLENVISMAMKRTKGLGGDEDILSQLVCALVGLGYQVDVFVLDAWSYGNPQSRSRLFVSFAAPGCEPLKRPEQSHAHHDKKRGLGLGKSNSDCPLVQRITEPTPFSYLTAESAIGDLPNIGDGRTYQCIPYPDHVVPRRESQLLQKQISVIPTWPRGSNFASAWNEGNGVMTPEQRELFPFYTSKGGNKGGLQERVKSYSKGWGRIKPQDLLPTIIVAQAPTDARMGRILHWDQSRALTVLEARRAQGFPDEEVLVGNPAEKWKIVGNSVARGMALALGLSLREAWLRTQNRAIEPAVVAVPQIQAQNGQFAKSNGVAKDEVAASATRAPAPHMQRGQYRAIPKVIAIDDADEHGDDENDEESHPDPLPARAQVLAPILPPVRPSVSNAPKKLRISLGNITAKPSLEQSRRSASRPPGIGVPIIDLTNSSDEDDERYDDEDEDEEDEGPRIFPLRARKPILPSKIPPARPGSLKRSRASVEKTSKSEVRVRSMGYSSDSHNEDDDEEDEDYSSSDDTEEDIGDHRGNGSRLLASNSANLVRRDKPAEVKIKQEIHFTEKRIQTQTANGENAHPKPKLEISVSNGPSSLLLNGNSNFLSAYAQTHRTMHLDRFRKHGPKSTW